MEGCGVRSAGCSGRIGRPWGGRNRPNHSENHAKFMRSLCEQHAAYTLLTRCLHPAYALLARYQHALGWLAAPGLERAEGFAHWAGHGRKEEVDANVPACLINSGNSSAGIYHRRRRAASRRAESLGLCGICRPCGQDQPPGLLVILVAQDPQLRDERHPRHSQGQVASTSGDGAGASSNRAFAKPASLSQSAISAKVKVSPAAV